MRLWCLAGLALLLAGCGSEDAAPSGTGGAGGSANKPPPGPSAEGWKSAYVDGGKASSCSASAADMEGAGLPKVALGDAVLYAGFEQVGDNQNPFVARFDQGQLVWCQIHETEPPDGRAVGVTWNGGDHAYVVYTVVGGGTSLEGKGGWLPSYATVLADGSVEFLGGSAHKPVDVDEKAMDCTDYPFDSRYRFSADLSQVLCADCSNCNPKQPCGS